MMLHYADQPEMQPRPSLGWTFLEMLY
ncbi:hypothetical protein AGR2A_Lc40009 [Agrobacterium genomosp. 2 str. CFBP 5494]|uniref:Uncharacterized protein n=1 Tax=Agrobacterium genomosp. 2 str. CFBP 5494 TaxID=1183436 RepID=A0A9W5F1G8_9HYPH|nr:hypothetical protein AGR2A_Lc40009 [Agrobacterium genomosp. 2 str. CFBP 5494]